MTILNKRYQFTLAIFSICLVLILSLSSASKTIHDGIFHFGNSYDSSQSHSGCSANHEGECKEAGSHSHSQGCDESCPVNIFASGILSLDIQTEIIAEKTLSHEVVINYYLEQQSFKKQKDNLVRGPPVVS